MRVWSARVVVHAVLALKKTALYPIPKRETLIAGEDPQSLTLWDYKQTLFYWRVVSVLEIAGQARYEGLECKGCRSCSIGVKENSALPYP